MNEPRKFRYSKKTLVEKDIGSIYGTDDGAENITSPRSAIDHENTWEISDFSSSDEWFCDWLPWFKITITTTTEVIVERCSAKNRWFVKTYSAM